MYRLSNINCPGGLQVKSVSSVHRTLLKRVMFLHFSALQLLEDHLIIGVDGKERQPRVRAANIYGQECLTNTSNKN
jgi:hypothetical protein